MNNPTLKARDIIGTLLFGIYLYGSIFMMSYLMKMFPKYKYFIENYEILQFMLVFGVPFVLMWVTISLFSFFEPRCPTCKKEYKHINLDFNEATIQCNNCGYKVILDNVMNSEEIDRILNAIEKSRSLNYETKAKVKTIRKKYGTKNIFS